MGMSDDGKKVKPISGIGNRKLSDFSHSEMSRNITHAPAFTDTSRVTRRNKNPLEDTDTLAVCPCKYKSRADQKFDDQESMYNSADDDVKSEDSW